MLIGNKLDQEIDRQVSVNMGKAMAEEHSWLFMEISAMWDVNEAFEALAVHILEEVYQIKIA